MKRVLSCLLIVILSGFTLGFAEVTSKKIKNPDGTLTRFFYAKGKEIAVETKDRNDKIIKTTGKIPDGIVKEYYGNGKLKSEYYYKDGKLDGKIKHYYESGLIREERNYENGKLDGRCRVYYTTGSLGGEWYNKKGKREGMTKLYWENGNIKAERSFKSGKQDGISKKYYNNGNLRYKETYKNGELINLKKYAENGRIIFDKIIRKEKNEMQNSK